MYLMSAVCCGRRLVVADVQMQEKNAGETKHRGIQVF